MLQTARLKLDNNEEYRLIACEYEFGVPIKGSGIPAGRTPEGGQIHFIIVSPDDNDPFFHDWALDINEKKDGTATFSTDSNNPSTKTLNFEDAYCVGIREFFDCQHRADLQMLTEIVISAKKISFGKKENEKNAVPLARGTGEDTLSYDEPEADAKEVNLVSANAPKENMSAKPKNSPDPEKWRNKGGKVERLDDGTWRYTDWEGNVVDYKNGHPDFKPPHLRQSVDIGKQKPDYTTDYTRAEQKSKLKPPRLKDKTVWHHHEDGKTMQEVNRKIHDRFTHRGGFSLYK